MIGRPSRDTMALPATGIMQRSSGMLSRFLEAIPHSANNQCQVIKRGICVICQQCTRGLKAERWCGQIAFTGLPEGKAILLLPVAIDTATVLL